MSTGKIIGIVLLVIGLYLGYQGINMYQGSGVSVEILDTKIGVSDDSTKSTSFLYMGLAIVLIIGGIFTVNKK